MKKMIISILLSVFFLFLNGYTQNYTKVKGKVSGTWTKAQSPYWVTESVSVPEGKKLVIEPGVQVFFNSDCKLEVGTENYWWEDKKPQLIARGTETDSILFAGYEHGTWSGINFLESGTNDTIAFAIIREIDRLPHFEQSVPNDALQIINSSPLICNSLITDNSFTGASLILLTNYSEKYKTQLDKTSPIIRNCEIRFNFDGSGSLFQCNQSILQVENTLIHNNLLSSYLSQSPGSIILFLNCTFAANSTHLGSLDWQTSGEMEPKYVYFSNSIVYNNWPWIHNFYSTLSIGKSDTLEFEYSNIDTSGEWSPVVWGEDVWPGWMNNARIKWGHGNLCEEPVFTDDFLRDYTLQPTSPCIDAGNPLAEYNDREDPAKPGYAFWPAQGTVRNDMGAYGWRSELKPKTMTSVNDKNRVISKANSFKLYPNFPNPFNPTTTISFAIFGSEHVQVAIFNLQGQKVATLLDEYRETGIHQVVWEAGGLPSGIYFCRLRVGNLLKNRKLVLQK